MSIDPKFIVTEIQRFCMHDGPGVRTTIFLKGCPLRCAWCHNPETRKSQKELLFYPNQCIACGTCRNVCVSGVHTLDIGAGHLLDREKCSVCGTCADQCPSGALSVCGKEYAIDELLSIIEKDRAFYGTNGGITLSGGEPLLQGEAAIALLAACKSRELTTVIETCGYVNRNTLLDAIPCTDLFLWDLKDTDDDRHKQYTGVSNKKILDNLHTADMHGAKIRLRCILINGINTDHTHYRKIAEIAVSLTGCEGVELIPYHAYGGTKSVFIGEQNNGRTAWIPEQTQIDHAKSILTEMGVRVI